MTIALNDSGRNDEIYIYTLTKLVLETVVYRDKTRQENL